MRNYQRKKDNPYLLPHNLYMRTIYLIKDYDRLKQQEKELSRISISVCFDDMPKAKYKFGSGVENSAVRLAEIGAEIKAIEDALETIPEFFRKPIMDNIKYGNRYPLGADERTFRRYKQRFIYEVANFHGG